MKRILVLAAVTLCLALRLAASGFSQQPANPQKQGTSPPPPPQAATYVGADTCIGCHDAEGKFIAKTPHGKSENPRSPAAAHGCESCHGPGSAHVEDPSKPGSIKRFPQMSPRDVSDTCLTCHSRGDARAVEGQHARRTQPVVHHVPLGAQPEVGERAAEGRHASLRPA